MATEHLELLVPQPDPTDPKGNQNAAPYRLDRLLADQIPQLSRSRVQKLIETGQIQINGQPITLKKHQPQPGDFIEITLPQAEPLSLEPEPIPLDILYEDSHLIILNKPAGLVVHPAPGHWTGTLVNGLLHHCKDLSGIGGIQRPGIVHRLDKDTTGAIVVAKHDQALQHLQDQIRAKTARREYLGLVHGSPATDSGTIDQPLGRHPVDRKRQSIVPLDQGGRAARTHWQLQERLGNYSLLHFQLETGRTHQIRVHSASIGHPILGDLDYSSAKSIGINLPGQLLHAWKLTLVHPMSGEVLEAIAPPPPTFTKILDLLRQRA